jgi:tetratricopeptide (TPR) repeat protein
MSLSARGSRKQTTAIEETISEERWLDARRLIKRALRREPNSHWLLARLALTHYEMFEYGTALDIEGVALAIAPQCPLVLWGYAGSLDMLDRKQEAITIYKRIVSRGVDRLANGECGEGRPRGRGLLADSLYRMALCYTRIGDARAATAFAKRSLAERGPGCESIYPIETVKALARRALR